MKLYFLGLFVLLSTSAQAEGFFFGVGDLYAGYMSTNISEHLVGTKAVKGNFDFKKSSKLEMPVAGVRFGFSIPHLAVGFDGSQGSNSSGTIYNAGVFGQISLSFINVHASYMGDSKYTDSVNNAKFEGYGSKVGFGITPIPKWPLLKISADFLNNSYRSITSTDKLIYTYDKKSRLNTNGMMFTIGLSGSFGLDGKIVRKK